ncbi:MULTISPECIES: D-glycero-alpha-D-manno-heptose-1,7-bisphosphate 7-phosphatase [Streptomyces]|uniref:D,D-heptose 1,7-bisphosphate phosphatase n=2 Tax=Streptomyces TaxID=1883 RepID=A0ABU2RV73_9ACTN|nr:MULTISPECIES: HAD family hydrolase [unclassified Streptomyces]MBK3593218.1 HAD family hydrolase [Streptomyces sp. MBT51]MDT0432198.1 HAD family hydrolase [Streptomyces sp. DSM 41770]HBF85040.1 haloacid dehalogenase [Streptomyces sp.]
MTARRRRRTPDTPAAPRAFRPTAVLFDRDGTLVHDVPYNGDPALVRPVPGAAEAVRLVREAGLPTGVVTNQSGIGRGLLSHEDVRRVNTRIDELIGPLDVWVYCPHLPEAGCPCRKPLPGLVVDAAVRLGLRPEDCAVIGDIRADVLAARAAGAEGILVPNAATLPEETEAEPGRAPDILTAVRRLMARPAARAVPAGGGPA